MGRNSVQGGNLFYSVQLKDETEKGIQEIKSKLSNLETTLKIKVDSKAFDAKLQAELGKIDNLQKALNNVSMSASSVKLPTVTTGDTAKAAADIAALTRVMDTMKATMDNIAGNGGTFVIPISIRDNTAQGIAALQAKLAELSKGLGIDITMTGKAESLTNILTTINSLKTGLTEVSALINQVSQNFAKASKNTIDNNIVSSWLSVAMKDMKKDLEHLNNALQNNAITLKVNLDTSAAKTDMTNFVILAKEISKALEGEVVTSKLNAWVDVISRVNLQFKELAKTIANIDANKLSAINNANKAIGESTSIDKNIKVFNRYGKMIQDLDYKIESIKVKMQSNTGFDNSKFEEAIKLLEDYKKKMQSILTSGDMNKIRSLVGGAEYKQQIQQANILLQQQRNLTKEEKERQKEAERTAKAREKEIMVMAQIAEKQLTISELASKTSKEIFNIATQSEHVKNIFGTFKELVIEAFSMWSLKGFLQNLIQIGGELEKQKLAVSSILGDEYKANVLFNQIGSLAIKSPFGVIELTQYAKQLTAYGVQYSELYDTMKRMADISAGVGVDMSRIILAYGQIKAAKFLRGQELRQLTEANIPMVDKLADRFEKLSGKAVTAGQVMEMISKKQVSFEDVKAVLFDMTNEGGMFFKMQEVLSESVSAKYKNLGDAIDLLYKRVTESTNGFLKFPAEVLTELTKNISVVIPIFTVLAFKCGILGNIFRALGQSVNSVTAMTNKNAVSMRNRLMTMQQEEMVTNKRRLSELELARATGQASAAEMREIVFLKERISQENMLGVAEMKRMFTELRLTGNMENWTIAETRNAKAMSLKLIRLGQVNKEAVQYLINMGLISKKEAQAAITAGSFSNALRGIGSAFKSLISVSNLVTIGIMAAVELFVNYLSYADKISKISDNMQRGVRGIKDGVNDLWDSTFKNLSIEKASEAQLKTALDKGVQFIRDNIGDYTGILNPIFELDDKGGFKNDLKERTEMVKDAIKDIKELADDNAGTYSRAILAGFKEADGGNWVRSLFQDNMFENAKDLLESQAKLIEQFSENITKYPKAAKNTIKELEKIYGEEMPNLSNKTHAEQIKIISENAEMLADFRRLFISQFGKSLGQKFSIDTEYDYRRALSNYADDIIKAYKEMSERIQNETGEIFDPASNEKQWRNFQTQLKLRIDSEEDVSEEAKQMIRASLGNKELISKLQMLVDDKTAKEKKKELEEEIRTKLWIDVEVEDNSLQEALNEVQTAFSGITIDPTDTMSIGLEKSNKAIGDAQKVLDTWKDVEYLQKNSKGEWEVKSPFLGGDTGIEYKRIAKELNDAEEIVKKQTENIHNLGLQTDLEKEAEKEAQNREEADRKADDAYKKMLEARLKLQQNQIDNDKKLKQQAEDNEYKHQKNILDLEEESYDKRKRLSELEHARNINMIKRDMDKQIQENRRFQENQWKLEDEANGKKGRVTRKSTLGLTAEQQAAFNKMIEDEDARFLKETQDNEEKLMQARWDYLKEYGSFLQKQWALEQEYRLKMSKASEEDKPKVQAEYSAKIQGAKIGSIKQEIDYAKMFSGFNALTQGMITDLISKLETLVRSKEFQKMNASDQAEYIKMLNELRGQLVIDGSNLDLTPLAQALDRALTLNGKLDYELAKQSAAKADLDNATNLLNSDPNNKMYQTMVKDASEKFDEAGDAVQDATIAYQDANLILQTTANNTQTAWSNLSSAISGLGSKSLKGIGDGLLKLDQLFGNGSLAEDMANSLMGLFGKSSPLTKQLAASLGNSDMIGQFIGVVLSILDVLKDGIINIISNIADVILQAINGLLSGFLSAEGITNLGNTLYNGVKDILDTITFGGLSSWLNTDGDWGEYEKMVREYEKMDKVWDDLIEKKKEYINESWGEDARKASDEAIEIVKKQIEANRKLGKQYMNTGSGTFSSSMGVRQKSRITKEDWLAIYGLGDKYVSALEGRMTGLFDLTAEELSYLKDQVPHFWSILDEDTQKYLQDIIDGEKSITDILEDTAERITGISFDSFRDNFIDSLMDMSKSSDDFVNDLKEKLMRSFIDNKLGKQIDEDLEKLYSKWEQEAQAGNTSAAQNLENDMKALAEKYKALVAPIAEALDYTGTSSSSSLTNGIQGVTEQTADLLASYINAIRADVSMNRLSIANIELSLFPQLNGIAQSQLQQLQQIADSTRRSADANEDVRDILQSATRSGGKKINVA